MYWPIQPKIILLNSHSAVKPIACISESGYNIAAIVQTLVNCSRINLHVRVLFVKVLAAPPAPPASTKT